MKPRTVWEHGLRSPGADALFSIFHLTVNLHIAFKTTQLHGENGYKTPSSEMEKCKSWQLNGGAQVTEP